MMTESQIPLPPFAFSAFSHVERIAVICFGIAVVAVSAGIAMTHDIYASIFYNLIIALFFLASIRTYWFYAHQLFPMEKPSKTCRIFCFALTVSAATGIALEGLTLMGSPLSSPLQLNDWDLRRIIIFWVLCFFIGSFACAHFSLHREKVNNISLSIRAISQKHGTLSISLLLIISICIAALVSGIFPWRLSESANRALFLALCILIAVVTLVFLQRNGSSRPELVFLTVALVCGTFLCFALPPVTAISPDDQIHFDKSLGLSYLGYSEYSDAEIQLANVPWVIDSVVQFNDLDETVNQLNSTYARAVESGDLHVLDGFYSPAAVTSLLNIACIGYIPSAAGLWLGRLLNLSLTGMIILGRWTNLLSYCSIFYLAVRNMPCKKTLLSVVGLLPTNLYLAANYSYDPWIISMLALSFSNLYREIYEPDKLITIDSVSTICLPMLLGLCPKAIYFPVIGLLFLIPKSKFASTSHRRMFYSGTVLFGLIIASTFVLPLFFSSSAMAGDARGGSDVSSGGQISFIIHHPTTFLKTLALFLFDYTSPITSDQYSITYFYMGTLSLEARCFATIPFILLLFTSLTDRQGVCRFSSGAIAWILFIVACTLGLVATSLYVSFTPVGLNWVNGCQPRYILPMLFLPLATIQTNKLDMGNTSGTSIQYAPIVSMGVLATICNLLLVVTP